MKKRGQFFILAAVIMSAVIISLGLSFNYANVNKEPASFYDLSYEIKQEAGEVIDYGVFSNDDKLEDFTGKIAESLSDKDPNIEVIFIYGDEQQVIIENYAKDSIDSGSGEIEPGLRDVESKIQLNIGGTTFGITQEQDYKLFRQDWQQRISPQQKKVIVKINQKEYEFSLSKNQQFFMLIKKTQNKEDYLDLQ
jgi:hypothetical protein